MPLEWERDDDHRYFVARVVGGLTPDDLGREVPSHRVGPFSAYGLLFDVSEATVSFTADQLRQIAARVAAAGRQSPPGPLAIVATNVASFGMARMYEQVMDGAGIDNIHVFRSLQEARTWLIDHLH